MSDLRNIRIIDLLKYRLPPAGIVSILHRISGMLIFFFIPFFLYIFEKSITSEISFVIFKNFIAYPIIQFLIIASIWLYTYHFCSGIRFLLLDIHIGINKPTFNKSALLVLLVSTMLSCMLTLKFLFL